MLCMVGAFRPIHMLDHHGFTMGALCEHAFVLAAPSRPSEDEKVSRLINDTGVRGYMA
jgi:hypothetical protein